MLLDSLSVLFTALPSLKVSVLFSCAIYMRKRPGPQFMHNESNDWKESMNNCHHSLQASKKHIANTK